MSLYTEAELKPQTLAALKKLATEHEIEKEDYSNKTELIKQLLKVEGPEDELDDELDDEIEDEEVAEVDDELEDEELDDELDEIKAELDAEYEQSTAKAAAPKAKPAPKTEAKKPAAKKTEGEGGLAAKQVATLLGIEAKTLRQFLRSPASTFEPVGSGGRYEFSEDDVPKLKEEFTTWKGAHAARGSKRGTKAAEKPPVETLDEVGEIEELEELDDEIDDEDLELDDEELDD